MSGGAKKVLSLRHLTSGKFGEIPDSPDVNFQKLMAPHLDSYNFFLSKGLSSNLNGQVNAGLVVKHHKKAYLELPNSSILCIYIKEIFLESPTLPSMLVLGNRMLYPKECTERGETYKGQLTALVGWSIDGKEMGYHYKSFGEAPIMVQSNLCNLYLKNMSPTELVERGELPNEAGGYFIINGRKRVMRLLIVNRRHYPFAMTRDSWKKLQNGMTNKGVMIRCATEDESALVNVLHYMRSGHVKLSCSLRDVLLPVVLCLQALVDCTDLKILKRMALGRQHDTILAQRVKMMLTENHESNIWDQMSAKKAIGSSLRDVLPNKPPNCTDEDVCDIILRNHVLPHLTSYKDKFYMLCFMTRKLFSFVGGDCMAESVDNTSMQEAWLGGFTCVQFTKDRFEDYVTKVKNKIALLVRKNGSELIIDNEFMKKSTILFTFDIGRQFKKLISTGTFMAKNRGGLPQAQGLTVVVEHLNKLRDLSHFRAIHRGKFFLEMKSTEPRKFTGEAWGFLCPVHTPDGTPCGLLNHLTHDCVVTTNRPSTENIRELLVISGMDPIDYALPSCREKEVEIILDGGIVGFIHADQLKAFVHNLKYLRIVGKIDKYTEIVNTKQFEFGGKYPAVFIFSSAGRLVRPVMNISVNAEEYVGSLEQLYLNVAVNYKDIEENVHTHYERSDIAMFSNVGRFVPFLDHNPSPRNLYQCQMAKQTMGTPIHNWQTQTENKLYRLMYPQVPLVRNKHYDDMHMEEFAMGTNACVAIISYSGYDMEDAMVINKASLERGFAKATVYKSQFIDLFEEAKRNGSQSLIFLRDPDKKYLEKMLSIDGLPYPQQKLETGDPYYCLYNETSESFKVVVYKGENCIVDKVSIMPSSLKSQYRKANITLRINRTPTIGDKFASRSGQKGIMSRAFPSEDMPFSDRGIIPDILFNPHGIPSRMTAGTLLEVIAGKGAAEHGISFNSTPFIFDDETPAYEYYGKILEKAGFDYFGEDTFYSGYSGKAIECHIFSGIVYYQRLRHMVADKWQVRATGLINMLTRQPVKGRNKGGAIRFGEMERDCLISHGAAYALQDRMMTCSDNTQQYICADCGDFLSTTPYVGEAAKQIFCTRAYCRRCGKDATVRRVDIPHALKVLVSELACMNVQVQAETDGATEILNQAFQ